jgi:signal transduction histidine kinase
MDPMIDPAKEAAIAPSLESVLSTGELSTRPSRPPDYETENRALLAIAQHMADSPQTTLQKLAEVALEICRADSAGVSLISENTGDFYWPAVAGKWKPHIGGGTPRYFGPCAVVIDRNAAQLFTHPERYYPYLIPISPPVEEALLTPFHAGGKAIGTVWVVAHGDARKFDAEDLRLIVSLGRFAAAVYPLSAALDVHQQQSRSLRAVNEGLLVSSLRQHELTEIAQNAEAALRESEGRLRLAGSAAKVGTWRLDLDTQLQSRDANMNRLMALEPVETTQPVDDFLSRLHPDDRPLVEAEIAKSIRERGPYKIECRIILPNGTTRWLLNQGHAILSSGESSCITGASVDVTLQKDIERSLRMANEDLEQFGRSASHDLQQPIRNISAYGELLGKEYGHLLDARGRDFLGIIMGGARRLDILLRDLRSYAQSGATENGVREEVRVDSALANALSDLSTAIVEAAAEVGHSELPTLWVHAVQLEQIFQNLIGNAIKYRMDNEPPRIYVNASREADQWIFSVRDNGIGIAAEHQKKIFGIFQRLNSDPKFEGSGIGLAICQKLVERNGGRIWVESEGIGKGSTFYFTVPVWDAVSR